MKALMIIGTVLGLATVAYAHGDDDKKEPAPKASTKSPADPKSENTPRTAGMKDDVKPLSVAEAKVVNDLHAANLTEVAAGKIGEKNGSTAAVRAYGRMLAKDHAAADVKLSALAKKRDFTFTSTAKDVAHLENYKGASFDSAFLAIMVKDHGEAIEAVKRAQQICDDAEVRKLLDATLPTLERHRAEALKLQQDAEQHAAR